MSGGKAESRDKSGNTVVGSGPSEFGGNADDGPGGGGGGRGRRRQTGQRL